MNKNFLKNFFYYGFATGASKFIGIILIPLYSRFFTPEEFGMMDLILSITSTISIFGILQLDSAVSRFFYDENEFGKKELISNAIWLTFLLSSVLSILIIIFRESISFNINPLVNSSISVALAATSIPFSNILGLFSVIIRFDNKPLIFGYIYTSYFLLSGCFTLILLYFFNFGIESYFAGQLIGYIFSSILSLRYIKKYISINLSKSKLIEMLKYSIPQVPAVLFNLLNIYICRYFMIGHISLSEIGLFNMATRISASFYLLTSAIRLTWLPFFYQTIKLENYKILIQNYTKIIMFFLFVGVLFFVQFSKELVHIFSTSSFYDSSKYIGILIISYSFTALTNVVGLGIDIQKKTIFNSIFTFCGLIINTLFIIVLIPKYGIYGILISQVISSFIILLAHWSFSEYLYPMNYSRSVFLITLFIEILNLLLIEIYNYTLFDRIVIYILIISTGIIVAIKKNRAILV